MKKQSIVQAMLAVFVLAALAISSCKKDNTPAPNTIAKIVTDNPNFSTLKAAVTKAGLADALSTGTLTVFAPDNDAFAASGITAATLDGLTPEQVANILKYHVLTTTVTSGSVPASDAVVTLQGQKLFASKNANGVFVNGIKVKTADISATNGVIHVIEKVLTPPTKTIKQIAAETASLSYLVAAVDRAGLLAAIDGPGKFTVFAPTNQAFIDAGFPTAASITAADQTLITTVVKYHVLPTNVFASDLINGATATTLQGGTLTIGTTPPSVKITTSAKTPSPIIVPSGVNIVATNGVVHLISTVLLP
jgi:uncharacterized surface protein with fasciclin (FAS1) repeats